MLSQMSRFNQLARTLNVLTTRQQLIPLVCIRLQSTKASTNVTASSSALSHQPNTGVPKISSNRIMKASISELNSVLKLIATKETSHDLLSLVEERLLSLMTLTNNDSEFDMVSKYLSKNEDYNYDSLCDLISSLAYLGRRPTPLLKAITDQILLLPKEISSLAKPKQECLIRTLNSLVKLNYINRALVSRLINDLTDILELSRLNSYQLCTLLRTISLIKWRPVPLLRMVYSHIKSYELDSGKVNHHVIVNFLQTIALLNFRPEDNIKQFYDKHMAGEREQELDRTTRKWLMYVYSLVCLNVANESHIRSILSQEFFQTLSSDREMPMSDIMKLLNVKALAEYELNIKDLDCRHLNQYQGKILSRKPVVEKSVDKVVEALNAMISSPNEIRKNIQTPFGFVIDCELFLDPSMQPIPLEQIDFCSPNFDPSQLECPETCYRCAIICSPYEDTIANSLNEVLGYKRIISRIMKSLNYETIFLSENLINQSKTSAELSSKLVEIFKSVLLKRDNAIKEP